MLGIGYSAAIALPKSIKGESTVRRSLWLNEAIQSDRRDSEGPHLSSMGMLPLNSNL
jgi:hypothetical protein